MQYGHFDNKSREYVIDRVDLPVSWTNYIGVGDMYGVFNHTAGGYLLYKTPEYHRITRFRPNGVPMDGPGHYIYIRDDETGDYWSVSWQPVGRDMAKYSCRHGLSYVKYLCDYSDIHAEQTLFVAMDDPVELWNLTLCNDSGRPRRLSVYSYCEFSFHQIDMDNRNFQMSLYAAGSSYADGIIEHELHYEENGFQFFAADFEPDGFDCLRDDFIGAYRTERDPQSVVSGKCRGRFENGGNHCGVLKKRLTLAPDEDARLIFMLGEGGRETGRAMREKYTAARVDDDFRRLAKFWDDKLSCLQISTPNEGMNTKINIWNLYQSEINVMFSLFTSFIEVGGRVGLGYRDTAQDAMMVLHSNPAKCRSRILDFSARQIGRNGICKGLLADWNDCLNLGGGESAMVSFLHYWALNNFVELARRLGRETDAEKYSALAVDVKEKCESVLWDSEWYIRGITADNRKIGTQTDEEGRVHMESNTWAVLSGAAARERGIKAMDSVDEYLYTDFGLMLNAPCYTKPDDGIGFVTRVYPGLKENGAIFSHPNPWAWCAEAVLGRGSRAMKFYNALCPALQNDKIEIRQSEPYSYCQFVVGRSHTAFGRARHPFMTGSAGWAYYAATQYILGVRPDFDCLHVDPCVPADWKEFSVTRKWRGGVYNIHVVNPDGVEKGVREIIADGRKVDALPVIPAGNICNAEIIMG